MSGRLAQRHRPHNTPSHDKTDWKLWIPTTSRPLPVRERPNTLHNSNLRPTGLHVGSETSHNVLLCNIRTGI
ncbi:hypothetical protein D3C75_1032280 [compost metagenome]